MNVLYAVTAFCLAVCGVFAVISVLSDRGYFALPVWAVDTGELSRIALLPLFIVYGLLRLYLWRRRRPADEGKPDHLKDLRERMQGNPAVRERDER
jgi:H+/Cl- antiporter ClcA